MVKSGQVLTEYTAISHFSCNFSCDNSNGLKAWLAFTCSEVLIPLLAHN